jgi:hypothetical protein
MKDFNDLFRRSKRDRELKHMVNAWPELSEGARFGLLMLAGLGLLRHAKVRRGLGVLAGGLRYRGGMLLRETGTQLSNAGQHISDFLRS